MSLIPSFALAKALRDVELFRPTGEQMHELVAEIRAWLDRVKFERGAIVDPAEAFDVVLFAKGGEVGPKRDFAVVGDDVAAAILRTTDEMVGG